MKAKIPIILGHQLQISRENEAISPLLILDRIVKVGAEGRMSYLHSSSYLCISCKFCSKECVRSFVRLSMQLFSFDSLSLSLFLFFSRFLFPHPPPKSHLIPPPPSLTASLPPSPFAFVPTPPSTDVYYTGRDGREGGRAVCIGYTWSSPLSSFLWLPQ